MLAFVFPGQGSQYPGMGKDLAARWPEAREAFEAADDALEFSLSRLCFEGPESELLLTENTQPAILTVSVAAYRVLEKEGRTPDMVAGHSLGEYSALVAAGSLKFEDAVRLVKSRGRFMQEAAPVGSGAMAAVIGLDLELVEGICQEASEEGAVVAPANINSPKQIVISGHAKAVERACELALESSARLARRLPVSAPFHSELMKPAEIRLKERLLETPFEDLKFPLYANVTASPVSGAEEARQCLIRQVSRPVRWSESVRNMIRDGAESFLEVGPGRVLTGLIRQIDPAAYVSDFEKSVQVDA